MMSVMVLPSLRLFSLLVHVQVGCHNLVYDGHTRRRYCELGWTRFTEETTGATVIYCYWSFVAIF